MSGLVGFCWNFALIHKGDLLSRSSLPENYYRNTGEKLININNLEFFKYNPFCLQGSDIHPNTLSRVEVRDIWRFTVPNADLNQNFKTMAHGICAKWRLEKCYKTNPDIYLYHEFETNKIPRSICVAPQGQTVGCVPIHILNFIRNKYPSHNLFQIGLKTDVDANVDFDRREIGFFESCKLVAECETMITIDSLPMWIARMYPSVRLKVILVNKDEEECRKFLPLGYPFDEKENRWFSWIELNTEYYNVFERDIGCTRSFLSI